VSQVVQSIRVEPRRYLDSIALLALHAEVASVDGIVDVVVAMATPYGRDQLRERGYRDPIIDATGPNDLVVAVTGASDACERAHDTAQVLLAPKVSEMGRDGVASTPIRTPHQFFRRGRQADIAVVSVPGPFAAATARVCIEQGMHTMIFSDNVSIEDEVALKTEAALRGVLLMGPDCGTAIFNGVPLGFANVVRAGRVAVIGASGTGMQEVTSRLHRLGLGVSQVIGCGGRDLTNAVGARTMTAALALVTFDANTDAIILVSKPPGELALQNVIGACGPLIARGIPVVAAFVGLSGERLMDTGIIAATSLANAADLVAEVFLKSNVDDQHTYHQREYHQREYHQREYDLLGSLTSAALAAVSRQASTRHLLHGAFCGGTFRNEAAFLLSTEDIQTSINGHMLIDFGDDEFTVGRPHPMIDSSARDEYVRSVFDRPDTAVVLLDIVLGYGAAADPISGLVNILSAQNTFVAEGPIVVTHVCGTDNDPQCRSSVVDRLRAIGVLVADSNADAVAVAAQVIASHVRRAAAPTASNSRG
jgi:FdrA protein